LRLTPHHSFISMLQTPRIPHSRKISPIQRRRVVLTGTGKLADEKLEEEHIIDIELSSQSSSQANVLVVNDSQEMAKEITMQLLLELPGSAITFAPSLATAKVISAKRKFDLIVASDILPDGSVETLAEYLAERKDPPDLLIVGQGSPHSGRTALGSTRAYQAVAGRSSARRNLPETQLLEVDGNIETLGADIRNDLNNPLMEIVAMAYVARASGELSEETARALMAIDRVAHKMADYICGIEKQIRRVVSDP
jgi:hypothetical protein